MFRLFGLEACGILAPQPGIEPSPSALEEVSTTLDHGSPCYLLYSKLSCLKLF